MALYACSALLGIAGQVRLTDWCATRWTRGQAIAGGLALMGLAFLPVALTAHLPLSPLWAMLPALACAILFTLGTLVAFPFEMATIADMAKDRLIGTYYGLYNLLSGIGILAGNLLAGATLDLARSVGQASLPWLLLAVAGLASGSRRPTPGAPRPTRRGQHGERRLLSRYRVKIQASCLPGNAWQARYLLSQPAPVERRRWRMLPTSTMAPIAASIATAIHNHPGTAAPAELSSDPATGTAPVVDGGCAGTGCAAERPGCTWRERRSA